MLKFDQSTLVLVAASVTLLSGLLLVYLKYISRHIKGPYYWSVGNLLISTAFLTFIFSNCLGNFITFVIGASAAIMGICLYYTGLRKFCNKSVNKWIPLGFPAFNLVHGTILTIIIPHAKIRMIIFSILNIALAVIMILEFLKIKDKSYRTITRLGAGVFIVFGAAMCFRLVSTWILEPQSAADETFSNYTLFFVSTLSVILMAFVFILLFSIKLSNELKEQVKNRDRFFSIIAHDLTGPVGTIAEMLKIINNTDLFSQKRQPKLLGELEKLSASTWLLLQNLLEWSRIQINSIKVTQKSFDLTELIDQNIRLLEQSAKSKSIDLKHISTEKISCFADSRMIDTVLRNIISNAIKFTSQNGFIEVSSFKTNNIANIIIKDNGIGIDMEVIERMEKNLQPDSTVGTEGEKGAGIGLILCKDFIEKNNGKLKLESKQAVGTKIILELPLDFNI